MCHFGSSSAFKTHIIYGSAWERAQLWATIHWSMACYRKQLLPIELLFFFSQLCQGWIISMMVTGAETKCRCFALLPISHFFMRFFWRVHNERIAVRLVLQIKCHLVFHTNYIVNRKLAMFFSPTKIIYYQISIPYWQHTATCLHLFNIHFETNHLHNKTENAWHAFTWFLGMSLDSCFPSFVLE